MKTIEPEHPCNAAFTDGAEQDFPICWIRADSLDQAGLHRRAAKRVWFGVCGFSHRIFRGAYYGPLDVIVFQDLVISKGRCEEERRCLAQQCPLNKTPDSMLKKLLLARGKQITEIRPLTQARHCGLFKKDPTKGGIVLPSSF